MKQEHMVRLEYYILRVDSETVEACRAAWQNPQTLDYLDWPRRQLRNMCRYFHS